MKTDELYPCCSKGIPVYLITFSVAGESKTYLVCEECSMLNYYKQFVISKVPYTPVEVN